VAGLPSPDSKSPGWIGDSRNGEGEGGVPRTGHSPIAARQPGKTAIANPQKKMPELSQFQGLRGGLLGGRSLSLAYQLIGSDPLRTSTRCWLF